MFPVFIPDDQTSSNQPPRPLGFRLLLIGLAMMFAAALALIFARGAGGLSIMEIIIGLALAMIGAGVVSLLAARTAPQKDKSKRGLAGLDMYSVIDRLVDDLDDDEAAYLRRRLDQRDEKAKDDLTLSVDELLNQRAQERDSR